MSHALQSYGAVKKLLHCCLQLGDIGREDAYRYEAQYTRRFEKEISIKHGDVLTGNCVFNSMDRTEVTVGGPGSQDEMCINFLLVYPAHCGMLYASFVMCVLRLIRPS
jgi:hypothetical protein